MKFKYVSLGYTFSNESSSGFVLNWSEEKAGTGQLTFIKKDGKTVCETEGMNSEFVKEILNYFINNIELVDV